MVRIKAGKWLVREALSYMRESWIQLWDGMGWWLHDPFNSSHGWKINESLHRKVLMPIWELFGDGIYFSERVSRKVWEIWKAGDVQCDGKKYYTDVPLDSLRRVKKSEARKQAIKVAIVEEREEGFYLIPLEKINKEDITKKRLALLWKKIESLKLA